MYGVADRIGGVDQQGPSTPSTAPTVSAAENARMRERERELVRVGKPVREADTMFDGSFQ